MLKSVQSKENTENNEEPLPSGTSEKRRDSAEADELDVFSCSICYQRFTELSRVPKVLQCGHTYCLSCLKTLALHGGPVLKCAVCRLCSTSIKLVPTNFQLLAMLNRMDKLEEDEPGAKAAENENTINDLDELVRSMNELVTTVSYETDRLRDLVRQSGLSDNAVFNTTLDGTNKTILSVIEDKASNVSTSFAQVMQLVRKAREMKDNALGVRDDNSSLLLSDSFFVDEDDLSFDFYDYDSDGSSMFNSPLYAEPVYNNRYCYVCDCRIPIGSNAFAIHCEGRRHLTIMREQQRRIDPSLPELPNEVSNLSRVRPRFNTNFIRNLNSRPRANATSEPEPPSPRQGRNNSRNQSQNRSRPYSYLASVLPFDLGDLGEILSFPEFENILPRSNHSNQNQASNNSNTRSNRNSNNQRGNNRGSNHRGGRRFFGNRGRGHNNLGNH